MDAEKLSNSLSELWISAYQFSKNNFYILLGDEFEHFSEEFAQDCVLKYLQTGFIEFESEFTEYFKNECFFFLGC